MKKSPLNDAKWANRDPGTNMTQKEKLENRDLYKKRNKGGYNLIKGYLDWDGDNKIEPWEIGAEAATWMVGGPIVKGVLKGAGKGFKFLKGALKRESSSPMNHCDSEMMHSGGWGQVRKYNSPGTTGNKEGIKHNEKMREEIGTFKMPHESPFNKGHEVNKDSIASAKAWKEHKAAYLKKEGGQEEYDREKGEFYYSPKHGKLRLIPTDDGEVQDRSGIEKWQLAPDRKSSALNQVSEAEKRRQEREADEPGETQFFRNNRISTNRKPNFSVKPPQEETMSEVEKYGSTGAMDGYTKTDEQVYNMTPDATPEESKAVRDKFDATYLKGRGPFQKKKEGKKDACYHKVKSRVKVWPSAYASGQLVQCRKAGAANWGEKSKKK